MLACSAPLLAQVDRREVRSGNRAFKKGDWLKSEIDYKKALLKDSTSAAAQYNLASALYRQENYTEAEKYAKASLDSLSRSPRAADAHYNNGDVYLKQRRWSEAIEAFKSSLRLNPGDMDAKSNLAYAQKMLENEQQQQDQNQDGGQDNQDQNKDQNQDQNQNDQDQNKDNQDQNQDQNKDDQNKDQNQDQNNDQNQDQNQPQNQPQDQKEGAEISGGAGGAAETGTAPRQRHSAVSAARDLTIRRRKPAIRLHLPFRFGCLCYCTTFPLHWRENFRLRGFFPGAALQAARCVLC